MKWIVSVEVVFILLLYLFTNPQQSTEAAPAITGYAAAESMIAQGQAQLREGDLVLRLNQDPSSQYIKNLSRNDQNFSHAGIVLYEGGYPYVYHILTGDENPDGRLRRDSLYRFCYPRKNFGFGIYRYNLDSVELKKLKNEVHRLYSKGLQFDAALNLKTDDQMYCSEMIKKSLATATSGRVQIGTTKLTDKEAVLLSSYLHLPPSYTKNLQVVAIDNLYLNSNCRFVASYRF